MSRVPFQVLVLPFRRCSRERIEYAVFKKSDGGYWQFIAGGGEDDETPLEAARREALEEAGILPDSRYLHLDSTSTVPVVGVTGEFTWGNNVFVIHEYTFGVEVVHSVLNLSKEHTEYKWVGYERGYDDAQMGQQQECTLGAKCTAYSANLTRRGTGISLRWHPVKSSEIS